MKKSSSLVLQTAIWLGIWLVFNFSGNPDEKMPMFYWVATLRVIGYIVFFNVAYYGLLPLYFEGRKRSFFALAALAFVVFVSSSVALDQTLGRRENIWVAFNKKELPLRRKPWSFILISPMFTGLALFGVAATIRGFSAFDRKKEAEEEANRRRLEAEIALLKSQINPHFLLNTLNNLYTLALTEPVKTPDALLRLSEMVSYILYECAQPKVSLASDIAFVKNYIDLQRLRLPPNIQLETEWPDQLPEHLSIEPMILIPFIENAFKHGLSTKGNYQIKVAIQLQHNQLTMQVLNPMLPPRYIPNGHPSGMGLANTRQRLQHSYAAAHTLHIENDGAQHRVLLQLTLGNTEAQTFERALHPVTALYP
jgi:two-component system, LytTR family, sensor kinase